MAYPKKDDICPRCGREVYPPDSRFCQHCGTQLTQSKLMITRFQEYYPYTRQYDRHLLPPAHHVTFTQQAYYTYNYPPPAQPSVSNTAMILGVLGGVFGIIFTPILIFMGILDEISSIGSDGQFFYGLAILGGILSILGIIGAVISRDWPKLGGGIMLACGIFGILTVLGLWIGALLLIAGGIVSILIKPKTPMYPPTHQTP